MKSTATKTKAHAPPPPPINAQTIEAPSCVKRPTLKRSRKIPDGGVAIKKLTAAERRRQAKAATKAYAMSDEEDEELLFTQEVGSFFRIPLMLGLKNASMCDEKLLILPILCGKMK